MPLIADDQNMDKLYVGKDFGSKGMSGTDKLTPAMVGVCPVSIVHRNHIILVSTLI